MVECGHQSSIHWVGIYFCPQPTQGNDLFMLTYFAENILRQKSMSPDFQTDLQTINTIKANNYNYMSAKLCNINFYNHSQWPWRNLEDDKTYFCENIYYPLEGWFIKHEIRVTATSHWLNLIKLELPCVRHQVLGV